MTPLRFGPITGLAAASLLLGAACGGSPGPSAAPTTVEPGSTVPASSAPGTTAATSAAASPEVTTAFRTFFDHFAGDPALLEDGETLRAGIDSLRSVPQAATVTVEVHQAKGLDDAGCTSAGVAAPCAELSFDLVVNGEPAVPNQTGYAVQQGGRWKVAKTTFCSLAGLGGSLPAGC